MIDINALYDAAARAGMLTLGRFAGAEVYVDFRAPDEDVLDGLVVNRNYSIRYPANRLLLTAGDTLQIAGLNYRVREVSALGDGSEQRAMLTRL